MKSLIHICYMLSALLLSCQTSTLDDESNDEWISSDLRLSIVERNPDNQVGTPQLFLDLSTVEKYPCANHQISTSQVSTIGTTRIEIQGTDIGDLCLTALGPASASLPLSADIKRLIIVHRGIENEYAISIDFESSVVSTIHQTNTFFDYEVYHRFPENTFAYLCGTSVQDQNICTEFSNHLQDKLALQTFTFPDGGKVPYQSEASGYHFNATAQFFKYENEDNLVQAGEILKSYYLTHHANKTGLGLNIVGWNGMRFHNDQRIH